jgi:hypothetical protein
MSDNTITRRECPEHGWEYVWPREGKLPERCANCADDEPKPIVTRTYVAVDALLSDEAIERVAERHFPSGVGGSMVHLQRIRQRARDDLQAAVDAVTGTQHGMEGS